MSVTFPEGGFCVSLFLPNGAAANWEQHQLKAKSPICQIAGHLARWWIEEPMLYSMLIVQQYGECTAHIPLFNLYMRQHMHIGVDSAKALQQLMGILSEAMGDGCHFTCKWAT